MIKFSFLKTVSLWKTLEKVVTRHPEDTYTYLLWIVVVKVYTHHILVFLVDAAAIASNRYF